MRRGLRGTLAGFACLAFLALPGSAAAAIEVESFSFGISTSQAGAHPDVTMKVSFAQPSEPQTPQAVLVQIPAGLFLYPRTLPRCAPQQLAADECPLASQVGVIDVHEAGFGSLEKTPVYLTVPEPGEIARLAFHSLGFAEPVEVPVRASAAYGYELSLAFEELPKAVPISSLELSLWGVPAAPNHDEERGPHAADIPGGRQADIPPTPFARNPTACGSTTAVVTARSYEAPEEPSSAVANGTAITGCGKVRFEPAVAFALSSGETSSPAGIELELQLPQSLTSAGIASSDLGALALYLPFTVTLNEGAASLQSACSLAQANLSIDAPTACPASAEIGSFGAALAGGDELEGSVYFGGVESPGIYRLFLVAVGGGLELKLPAWLSMGNETELVIPDLPQLPLANLDLEVDPAVSLLLTPPWCGDYEGLTEAVGWSQPDVAPILSMAFTIASGPSGSPCPEPVEAGEPSSPSPGINPPVQPAPQAPRAPVVTLRKYPPHRDHDRTPSFSFTSSVSGSEFRCKVDHRSWRPCHSPLTLRKLPFGRHAFRVEAIAPAGAQSPSLTYRFVLAPS